MIEPTWSPGYKLAGDYAKDLYGPDSMPLFRQLHRITSNKALFLARPIRGSWLEVGCGPGALLPSLAASAARVVGLDFGMDLVSDAAALTRHMCGAPLVVRGDAYFLPFRKETFDGIVCLETLEHLRCGEALKELHRVLKKGGRLVASVPVEIGTALMARQVARFVLRLKNQHFYPMKYHLADMIRMAFLISDLDFYRNRRVPSLAHHLYFSYRGFLEEANELFRPIKISRSPIRLPGPWSFSVVCLFERRSKDSTENLGLRPTDGGSA